MQLFTTATFEIAGYPAISCVKLHAKPLREVRAKYRGGNARKQGAIRRRDSCESMQISEGGALPVTLYGVLIGYRRKVVPLRFSVSLVVMAPSPLRQFFSMKCGLGFYQ